MNAALRMLSRRSLSEGEIREKLSKKGFPPDAATGTIQRLRELGLVDDPKLCDHLVRVYREARGYGSGKIAWALRARGFPPELVEDALRHASSEEVERETASNVLRKKFRGGLPPGRESMAKAFRFLAGRGFPPGICRRAVRDFSADIQEGEG